MKITTKGGFTLNAFAESDAAALAVLANDPQIYGMTMDLPHPYTFTDALDWINYNRELSLKYQSVFSYAIRKPDGTLVGSIGRRLAMGYAAHQDELGYWIGATFRRQGIMKEVLPAYRDHLLTKEGLSRLSALVFPENTPSIRLLEQCGFEKEGHLHHYFIKDGCYKDALIYAIW